jgi:hypothetical protein
MQVAATLLMRMPAALADRNRAGEHCEPSAADRQRVLSVMQCNERPFAIAIEA